MEVGQPTSRALSLSQTTGTQGNGRCRAHAAEPGKRLGKWMQIEGQGEGYEQPTLTARSSRIGQAQGRELEEVWAHKIAE